MYHSQMIYLETAYEFDIAESRSRAKNKNFSARLRNYAFKMTDRQFIKRYRLSKEITNELIDELSNHMPPSLRSDALNVDTKVLIALAFYATGSYQTIVGDCRKHCVSQASVSKAIRQVTNALNKASILNKYIAFPSLQLERECVKREFYQQYKMPGLIGCIDGTHVAIVRPTEHEERFFNRKGYHSLNVQIIYRDICDSKMNIMCVDASYPGSTHDSVVWSNHPLKGYLERLHNVSGEDLYLLGDSGYSLRTIMMTPILNPEPNSPDAYYQGLHLTARNVVERCIGVLKARFRCLLVDRKLHYKPVIAAKMINACCVLHNIANKANLHFIPLGGPAARLERSLTEGASGITPRVRRALSELEMGRARQCALVQQLWTNRAV